MFNLNVALQNLFGVKTIVTTTDDDTITPTTDVIQPQSITIDVWLWIEDDQEYVKMFTEFYTDYEVARNAYYVIKDMGYLYPTWCENYTVWQITTWNSRKRMFETSLHLSGDNAQKRIDQLDSKGLTYTCVDLQVDKDEMDRLFDNNLEWKEGK